MLGIFPVMTQLGGFWSYTHADDETELGRIAELARDIAAQYEMLTGEAIEVFLDRDALEWGNAWREKVDENLATVAFFIPVVTPRYFQSPECRRELRTFATQAGRLGLSGLLMPLLYVDFAALHDDSHSDELISLIKDYQWADWSSLRFSERKSAEYRRGVSELAGRLVSANAEAARALTPLVTANRTAQDGEDDQPGLMDRMADAEEAMPNWAVTVERIGKVIEQLGPLMDAATERIEAADKQGKGFAGRLAVTRKLARDLAVPADEIVDLGNQFAQELAAVDSGIRAIIEVAPEAAASDADERRQVEELFTTIRGLSEASETGLGQVASMIEEMAPIERMSRDLREPLRRMRQGLTSMIEGRQITTAWVQLIDATGLGGPIH